MARAWEYTDMRGGSFLEEDAGKISRDGKRERGEILSARLSYYRKKEKDLPMIRENYREKLRKRIAVEIICI